MISLRPLTCLLLLLGGLLLAACGSEDGTQPDQATAEASVATAPQSESSYTAAPSPLITPAAPDKPGNGSAADLPPVTASIPADAANRINMTVRDPLPVSAATLIDPQGNRIVASRIDRDRVAYTGRGSGWPRIGVGVSGGSSSGVSTGFGIGFPLLPQTTEAAGSIYESRFNFAVPDATAYAASWQRWKVHIDLSDGVNSRSFETLPPAPPQH